MSFTLLSLSIFLTLLTSLLLHHLLSPHSPSTSNLPGPSHTRYTSLPLLYHEFSSTRRLYIHNLHIKYGPIVRISPGEISILSPSALKTVYANSGGWEKSRFYDLMRIRGVRTMFSSLGKVQHKMRKRGVAGGYARTRVWGEGVLEGVREGAGGFVGRCEGWGMGEEGVDVYVLLHCFALDCATHFIFGKYGTHSLENPEDEKLMRELSFHSSLKKNLLHLHFPTLAKLLGRLAEPRPTPLTDAYVQSTAQQTDAGEHTLLHTLQTASENLGEDVIVAECLDHLAAGIDTTGDALCFLLYQLSLPENSAIQDKLADEVHNNREQNFEDLPYLDAVIMESLRLYPPIPMSQPRIVPKGGRVVDGWFVAEGMVVGAQAWSVHRLNGVFSDSEKFQPERWLDTESRREMEKVFFAFGMGSRGCTGRFLAMAEMKILVRAVYERFCTSVVGGSMGDMEVEDQIISSRPRGHRCVVRCEERKW